VIPGAWLQTAAKTRLTGVPALALRYSPRGGPATHTPATFVDRRRHRVDAGAHRAVARDARAHRLDVLGPRHAEVGGEVHQQLAVGAEHVHQAEVAALDRAALLGVERIFGEQRRLVVPKARLHPRVAIQVVEELLHPVEAHRRPSACAVRGYAPQRGMWCPPSDTATFFGSRNTS
jgi:hypothetical protein